MSRLISLLQKNKSVLAYIFFGGCTTLVNVVVYWLSSAIMGMPNILAVVVAWGVAVSFAFFTNKLWVFDSKSLHKAVLLYELSSFYACRLLTGGIDVGVMYVAVDVFELNPVLWKTLADVFIIVANFVASKYLIFIHKDSS